MNLALLKASLRKHEGERLKVYLDTKGIATIGVGRNLVEKGISRGEMEILLDNDCIDVMKQCGTLSCWHRLSDVRQRVLAEMCLQIGFGGLQAFRKMFAAIDESNFAEAADQMLDSKWATVDSPNRAFRLSQMMRTNQDVE